MKFNNFSILFFSLKYEAGNGSVTTGIGKMMPRGSMQSSTQPMYSTPNQPFEDVLLRQRTLGQDIIPSPREPKRTESLYTPQKPTPSGLNLASAGIKSGKLKVCSNNLIFHSFLINTYIHIKAIVFFFLHFNNKFNKR